jgi:FtsZ-binding cell division protein ZapB
MNIEEIKDSLQSNNFTGLRARLDTVIEFIDSQQAKIESLKAENSHLKYEISSGAWNSVPLTDEEIKFIAYPFERVYTTYDKQTDTDTVHTRFDQLGFAKAILRKAQENENKP